MRTKKVAKSALFTSVLALVLCLSMLVGTTFAWFTDSVTSKNNVIKSGNLDVVVEYSMDGETWAEVKEDTALFSEDALWEPGHTEYVYLRVKNAGTLALKYVLKAEVYTETPGTNVYNEEFKLSDHLMYGVVTDEQFEALGSREAAVEEAITKLSSSMDVSGGLEDLGWEEAFGGSAIVERSLLSQESNETALIITMPTTVENEANHLTGTVAPKITFGVNVYATQLMHEEDSFGDDYDKDSEFPVIETPTGDNLNDALANGGSVAMGNDANVDAGEGGLKNQYGKTVGIIVDGGTFDGQGNTLTVDGDYAVMMYGGTVKNLTIDGTGAERGIMLETLTKDVVIDNVTVDGPGYVMNTTEGGSGTLTVKNSTLNGWTSIGNDNVTSVLFQNTNFGMNTDMYWQNMGYDADYDRLVKPYVTTVFDGCTFEKDFYVDLSSLAAGETVAFVDCYCEGVELTAENYGDYITIENYDASYVFFGKLPIASTESLQDAITAGGDVTVDTNITVDSGAITVAAGTNTKIDLNGTTTTGNTAKADKGVYYNEGTMTISNGAVISAASNGGSALYNAGTMTVEGGSYTGAPCADGGWASYAINNYGTMEVSNATVVGNHGAISASSGSKLTLNDVSATVNGFGGSSHVIYVSGSSSVIINGGEYIHNGNIDGSLCYINSGSTVTINGGTFTATGNGAYGVANMGTLIINGGTFNNSLLDWGGTITITGGTFKSNPTKYLAEGYTASQVDGMWVVAAG